ncbi:MAG: hypothetical protein CMJ34_00050 [Phycisphaerae bacterium]|nr:hypothetical protein [Phycisphaerae bacterium]
MSNERADVRSIEVIDAFRATLAGFVDAGRAALLEAESDLEKTILWLDRDRIGHWNRQIRKRQELLTRARSELYRKQMQTSAKGGRAGDSDERKNLQRAERHLEEARRGLEATRTWIRRLDRERTLYKAAVSPLATALDHDLPHAIGLLRKMSENLEAYTSMPAPELARLLGPTEDEAESTRRTASATMEVPASEDEPDEEETGTVPSKDRQEPAP